METTTSNTAAPSVDEPRLVRLEADWDAAATRLKEAVAEAYPVGAQIRVKLHGNKRTVIDAEVIGHGASWSNRYPTELTVRNLRTGKRRSCTTAQVEPNVPALAQSGGEITSTKESNS